MSFNSRIEGLESLMSSRTSAMHAMKDCLLFNSTPFLNIQVLNTVFLDITS